VKARIRFYGSVDGMNIEGLGPALVDALYAQGLVRSVADLYSLEKEQVARLDRMGETSAENLVRAIDRSRSQGLSRLLTAVGIRNIGTTSAALLARRFRNLSSLMKAGRDELEAIDGIGPVLAESITAFFANPRNRETLTRLEQAGVGMNDNTDAPRDSTLEGKIFVCTGTLERFSRKEVTGLITSHGGRVSSSVSGKTDYVVAGADPGSKAERAGELNIPILTEQDLIDMIGAASNEN
jgi:DNA ligase (NAD+)